MRDQAAAGCFQTIRKIGNSKMPADRFTAGVSQFGGKRGIADKAIDPRRKTGAVARAEQKKILSIA